MIDKIQDMKGQKGSEEQRRILRIKTESDHRIGSDRMIIKLIGCGEEDRREEEKGQEEDR